MSTYVNLLISNGTDVNAKNTYGETPLFLCNHQKSLLSLIKHGADVGILSNDNETPLFTCNNLDSFKTLVENGVDVTQKNTRRMTVHEVLKSEHKYTNKREEILWYMDAAQKIAMWARMVMAKNKVYMKRIIPDNLFKKDFYRKRMEINGICDEWVENVDSNK